MRIMTTKAFRRLADSIVCLQPDLLSGEVTVDQVKIILGEIGDIWPASIFEEVVGDETTPIAVAVAKLQPQLMDSDEATPWAILEARYGAPNEDD